MGEVVNGYSMDERNGKAIGKRIKTARLLAGCTRKELETIYGISANTVQAWEIGRSPLTLKGAKRFVSAMNRAGMQCSIEWLLSGEGLSPYSFNDLEQSISDPDHNALDQLLSKLNFSNETDVISKELAVFKVLNDDSITLTVMDDAMEPNFPVGSFVGGKRLCGINIAKALGKVCIVELSDHNFVLRKVIQGRKLGRVTLSATNPFSNLDATILYDQKIISAAPVIWHRLKENN